MKRTCLLILNTPIWKKIFLQQIKQSGMLICTDGGINRLFNLFKSEKERGKFIPNYVVGDFDSLKGKILKYYKKKGTKAVKFEQQDTNDFQKSLTFVKQLPGNFTNVKVLQAFKGRLDHTLANIIIQYQFSNTFKTLQITGLQNTSRVLSPGNHTITLRNYERKQGCGLIPLFGDTKLKTNGLKWDLSYSQKLQMNGLISTSNEFQKRRLKIRVKGSPVLFVTQLRSHEKQNLKFNK